MLSVIVLLQNPFLAKFQLPDWWREFVIQNLLIWLRIQVSLDNMVSSRSRGKKAGHLTYSPPCFNVGMRVLCLGDSAGFTPNMIVSIVTKQFCLWLICSENGFRKVSCLTKCSQVKFKRTPSFFVESRGFLLATSQRMPNPSNFCLIEDTRTFTPGAIWEVWRSHEVMCGLAFTWFIIF